MGASLRGRFSSRLPSMIPLALRPFLCVFFWPALSGLFRQMLHWMLSAGVSEEQLHACRVGS